MFFALLGRGCLGILTHGSLSLKSELRLTLTAAHVVFNLNAMSEQVEGDNRSDDDDPLLQTPEYEDLLLHVPPPDVHQQLPPSDAHQQPPSSQLLLESWEEQLVMRLLRGDKASQGENFHSLLINLNSGEDGGEVHGAASCQLEKEPGENLLY